MIFWQPYWILMGYIYYEKLIGIFFIFWAAILNWNFRLLDSDFFVGLMLYHCLRCWSNIKTTLHRCSCLMELQLLVQSLNVAFEKFYCPYQVPKCWFIAGHCLRRWLRIETLLDICILIIKCRGCSKGEVSHVASDKWPLFHS